MRKPKFGSSIKILHHALVNFRPIGHKNMTGVCIQQVRDVYNGFNTLYCSPSIASSSSSTSLELCSLSEDTEELKLRGAARGDRFLSIRPPEEESSLESFSASDSAFASSFLLTGSSSADLALKKFISSKRFFFSPFSTKSIMEEGDILPNGTEKQIIFSQERRGVLEIEQEKWGGRDRAEEEMKKSLLCRESVTMTMASENPYNDFRVSMEEMVEAHGLREWSCLLELLHCYLRLNDTTNHKVIVLAFVDLLINLMDAEEGTKLNNNNSNDSYNNNNKRDRNGISPYLLPLSID